MASFKGANLFESNLTGANITNVQFLMRQIYPMQFGLMVKNVLLDPLVNVIKLLNKTTKY